MLALATLAIGGAQVVKVLVPGRRLRDAGVPRRSIVAGVVLAIVGFFVIPVVGFFIGFPLGVYVEERRRAGPAPGRVALDPGGAACDGRFDPHRADGPRFSRRARG